MRPGLEKAHYRVYNEVDERGDSMKSFAIAAALVLFTATASAQSGGMIALFSDVGYSDCNLTENVLVTNYVYVVHFLVAEAQTSQFMVDNHWATALVAGVNYASNLKLGDIFTGVAITYVGCKPLPHLLATITFIPLQATAPCYALEVVPDPVLASGEIEVIDCANNVLYGYGATMCVNIPECCLISASQASVSLGDCAPVGAQSSTWGGIKALYR